MRGAAPIEIPVPVAGWRADLPPHRLAPDTLRSGLNMLVGLDGILAPRGGYERLTVQPRSIGWIADHAYEVGAFVRDSNGNVQECTASGTSAVVAPAWATTIGATTVDGGTVWTRVDPDPRLVAGIGFEDESGIHQVVVATLTQWFALQSGAWVDITGAPFSGDKNTPTRLVQFGSWNNQSVLYGVNGYLHDGLRRWLVGDAVSARFGTDPFVNRVTGPTTIAADDMDVIADRLVLVNTHEDGVTHYPNRSRWSSVIDGSSFPGGAWNDLAGIGNLVAVRAVSRRAGVVYGDHGGFIMYGQPGDDAGAFAFDRIEGVTVPPLSPSALISVGGVHYYLGTDLHVWRCDGQSATIISGPIDAAIRPGAEVTSLAVGPAQKPVTMYDETGQRLYFFVTCPCASAQQPLEEAQTALVFNLPIDQVRGASWQVPQIFPDGITCAFPVIEQLAPTWDNPGVHGATTLTAPLGPDDTTIRVASTRGFPDRGDGGTVSLPIYDAEAGTGELVAYAALTPTALLGCTRGAFGTTPVSHALGTAVTCEVTWDDADLLWPDWNAIPDSLQPVPYVGTASGFACRFGSAARDPEQALISYAARWGLISSPNATQELQINTGEVILDPIASDDLALTIRAQRTVFEDGPPSVAVPIADELLVGDDRSTWLFRLKAIVATAAFKPANYLDVQLSGRSANRGPRYAGAYLYADVRQKPDRLPAVGLSGARAQ